MRIVKSRVFYLHEWLVQFQQLKRRNNLMIVTGYVVTAINIISILKLLQTDHEIAAAFLVLPLVVAMKGTTDLMENGKGIQENIDRLRKEIQELNNSNSAKNGE